MPHPKNRPLQNTEHARPGLYIHIPFCRSKCPYCDFYSIASLTPAEKWLEALKKEMRMYCLPCKFDTVYLGGGTPSVLDTDMIDEILETARANFRFYDDMEITIEVNPGDITSEKAEGLKASGINRVNLGVQSFDDRDLSFLGRRHSSADAENACKNLRKAGFENIGIDLIYGLQGQTVEAWLKTLEKALELKPEHISCYQLTIEGKTVFKALKKKGKLCDLPEEDAESFFIKTSDLLEAGGYIHYEVSNFASGPEYRSRHNIKYWNRTPCLGLGPSAHSFDGHKRWWNHSSVKKYLRDITAGIPPVDGSELLTEEQALLEKVSLLLRTEGGVEIKDLVLFPDAENKIQELELSGHLIIREGRIVPTKKGLLVADRLPLYITD